MDQSLRPHDFFCYRRVWPISCSVQKEKYAKGNRIRQKVKTSNDVAVYFVQRHLLANVVEELQFFSKRLKTRANKIKKHATYVTIKCRSS